MNAYHYRHGYAKPEAARVTKGQPRLDTASISRQSVTCASCGRQEAVGAYCTGCGRR